MKKKKEIEKEKKNGKNNDVQNFSNFIHIHTKKGIFILKLNCFIWYMDDENYIECHIPGHSCNVKCVIITIVIFLITFT